MAGELILLRDPASSLFWTSPPPKSSELATEDPLALDYIGQQIGLWLLPALTTRSSRAQAFAMVLYGLDLAERATRTYGLSDTDETRRLLFERWERFWALATVESRDGDLQRSDPDAMRGIRGALAAWRPGNGTLPLDFPLISRQQELGNLGAYLSPLRRAGLVIDGTLRPSPAGLDIVDAFWDEADNKHRNRYQDYALAALDRRETKLTRVRGNLTLNRVGKRSRLSVLSTRPRPAQQLRLYEALFARARDTTTLGVSQVVSAATLAGVDQPRGVLHGAIAGRFGEVSSELHDLFVTALRFGEAMSVLLRAFDRTYCALTNHGWSAPYVTIAARGLDGPTLAALRETCVALLAAPYATRIRGLPMHGAACMRLAEQLVDADATAALAALLAMHHSVQRERRRGEGWIRHDGGRLAVLVSSYTARPDADRFPSFKLDAVRSLLADTGRLPSGSTEAEREADE